MNRSSAPQSAVLDLTPSEAFARKDRASAISAERRLSGWILLAAIACFAALAAPFFAGQVYVADDLGEFHLPLRNFYARQLAAGEAFDWMPSLYGGFDVAAEGQLGGYHPWHWVLYRILRLGAAFDIELLASFPLVFGGMFWWLWRLVGRRDAALLGALVFTFGGFNLLHFVHPNAIAVVAHLPWLLALIDVALTTTKVRSRALAELGVGLLTASQLLLGYPQYVWFSLLAEAAFIAWRAVGQRVAMRHLATLGVAILLGIAGGAVQWLPTMQALQHSTRHDAGGSFANSGSLDPLNLVQLVAPYLFQTRVVGQNTHELGLYIGAVPFVLCVWLLAQRRQWGRFRPLVRALIVCGGLALLLAAGDFAPLYRLQAYVPLANSFRFPCRAIVLFQLCAAGLAAVAFALLLERKSTSRHETTRVALGATLAASVLLAIVGPLVWPEFVAGWPLVWCGPILIVAAVALTFFAERGWRFAPIALTLLVAIDLGVYGMSNAVFGRTANLHDYVAGVEQPPDNSSDRVVAPRVTGAPRVGDRMLLAGLSRIDGYAGLEPQKQLDDRRRSTWQLAGAAWAWLETDPRYHERNWVLVTPTAPRARLVTKTIDRAQLNAPERPLLDAVVAEPSVVLPAASPGQVRVIDDAPGRIALATDCPTQQLLVTTESFDPSWQVTCDNKPGVVVRIDGDFLGCRVESGQHLLCFQFHSRYRQLGVLISACGLGLLVLGCCSRMLFCRPARDEERSACCEKH